MLFAKRKALLLFFLSQIDRRNKSKSINEFRFDVIIQCWQKSVVKSFSCFQYFRLRFTFHAFKQQRKVWLLQQRCCLNPLHKYC